MTLLFFVTYTLFQPPSTIVVRKLGPRIHLAGITLLWGAVMIGMGFTKDWGQLAALRVILGILEAGFFPSCVYLLSTWYPRCKYTPALLYPRRLDTNGEKTRSVSGTLSFTSSAASRPLSPVSSPLA